MGEHVRIMQETFLGIPASASCHLEYSRPVSGNEKCAWCGVSVCVCACCYVMQCVIIIVVVVLLGLQKITISVIVHELHRKEFTSVTALINSKKQSRIKLRILRFLFIRKKNCNPMFCNPFRPDSIRAPLHHPLKKKNALVLAYPDVMTAIVTHLLTCALENAPWERFVREKRHLTLTRTRPRKLHTTCASAQSLRLLCRTFPTITSHTRSTPTCTLGTCRSAVSFLLVRTFKVVSRRKVKR